MYFKQDEQKDPGNLKSILGKYSEVFAVENWSSTSNLLPVAIELMVSTPAKCPIISQA